MSQNAEQRLALSRILIATAVRERTWVVLLQRWVERRSQRIATGHRQSAD
jgi:hypothetical protein